MNDFNVKNKDDILKMIVDILVNEFECDESKLLPEARLFEDLDLDSIDAVDLIVKLQQITGKKINPLEFKQVRTLQNVVDVIHKIFTE